MQPRMLVTFDTDLRPLPVSVRVGQVSGRPVVKDALDRRKRGEGSTLKNSQ